ncbi:MAG: hypothetical protein ACTSYD_06210 [Candidatus Heimdallarchaeaceae archaeon]
MQNHSTTTSTKGIVIRSGFGLLLPVLLELLFYSVYTGLRTGTYQFSILLLLVFIIIPLLFIYLIAPKIIFSLGGVKKHIYQNISTHLEEIFFRQRVVAGKTQTLTMEDIEFKLSSEEKGRLIASIKNIFIPQHLKEAQKLYRDNFIDRRHDTAHERLLTYYEALYLFALMSTIILAFDFILVLILHTTSIRLDFIYLDQIVNPVNVIIFASIFALLFVFAFVLLLHAGKELSLLIPKIVPIIYFEDEKEREKRFLSLIAIAEFPISNIFIRRTQRELARTIEEAKRALLYPALVETLSWYYREQLAKHNAWQLYKEVLEQSGLSDDKKRTIERQFKYDPFTALLHSELFSKDEEIAIKADLDYIKERIENWDKARKEEQMLAFLLTYRVLEIVFRRLIETMRPELGEEELNFLRLIDILEKQNLISKDEASLLHEVRYKRNLMFHEPGKAISVNYSTMNKLLQLIQLIIERTQKD